MRSKEKPDIPQVGLAPRTPARAALGRPPRPCATRAPPAHPAGGRPAHLAHRLAHDLLVLVLGDVLILVERLNGQFHLLRCFFLNLQFLIRGECAIIVCPSAQFQKIPLRMWHRGHRTFSHAWNPHAQSEHPLTDRQPQSRRPCTATDTHGPPAREAVWPPGTPPAPCRPSSCPHRPPPRRLLCPLPASWPHWACRDSTTPCCRSWVPGRLPRCLRPLQKQKWPASSCRRRRAWRELVPVTESYRGSAKDSHSGRGCQP